MKTITIKLDNDLEKKLTDLSENENRDISDVVIQALSQSLSEKDRRARALQALDEVFSRPIPSPFNIMTEEEIIEDADKEILAVRQAH